MNREILFRGKRVDNGKWVEGDLGTFHRRDGKLAHEIHIVCPLQSQSYWNEVIPETIGQYVGKEDKNGKKIFEGDMVLAAWYDYNEPMDDIEGEVIYNADCMFEILDMQEPKTMPLNRDGAYVFEVEVIGNIYGKEGK